MRVIENIKKYLRNEAELIDENKETVRLLNRTFFTVLMGCAEAMLIILFVSSFCVDFYKNMRISYAVIFIAILLALFSQYYRDGIKSPIMYYIFYGIYAIYAAYSSAFVTPDYIGIMILLALFEIPVFLLDKTIRVILFEVCISAIYLSIVVPNKLGYLVPDEIVNTLVFCIVGGVTSIFFRKTRLESIDLSRRLNIQRTTDVLTGLANRRMLFEYFGDYESKKITATPYAIAIMDIDNFKQFNDTYGHIAGDKCLNRLGECFTEFGNEYNTKFYRYGGEEFIAVVNDETELSLTDFFTELNKRVEALKIPHSFMSSGFLTISIGVKKIEEVESVSNFERVINVADEALYKAKKMGKNMTIESK